MAEAGPLRMEGRGVSLSEETEALLSNSQKSNAKACLSFPSPGKSYFLHDLERSLDFLGENGDRPSLPIMATPGIDDLEESLRKLKVQVENMTSSLNFHREQEGFSSLEPEADSRPFSSRWPVAPGGNYEESVSGQLPQSPTEMDWFLKPRHLLRSLGDYSTLSSLGLPTLATTSPTNHVAGLLGSEIMGQNVLPSVDFTFPLKTGPPHVVGVKSLLPPKIPNRASVSFDRGRPLSLDQMARSRSFSPPAKRTHWRRSRSQSPRPPWMPNSAKVNACAQPPPPAAKLSRAQKKNGLSRQSRAQIYRPGTLANRSWSPKTARSKQVRKQWSPYSLASTAISSPMAQEINERFLQVLAKSSIGKSSLTEISPYQQELACLRLQRLRMEEAWLLELKRQQELERTRGPKPKWYEMRNSQFHYEARKNNELLRNSRELQAVSEYRQELATVSKEFQPQSSSTYLVPGDNNPSSTYTI